MSRVPSRAENASRPGRAYLMAMASLAVSAVIMAAATPARADTTSGMRVGIVVLSTVGVTQDEAEAVSERMGKALGARLLVDVEVGTRERLGKRPSPNCIAEPACIHTIGTTLDVKELLFLAVIRLGQRLQISVTWADVATGATEGREPIRVEETEDDQVIFADAATRLLPEAPVRSDIEDTATATPTDPSSPPLATTMDVDGPRARRMSTGVWIAGGIGALALVGGTTLGIMALRTEGRLEDAGCDPGPCDEPASTIRSLERQSLAADALFATAIVSGAVAGYLYWRSGSSRPSGVALQTSPTSVGLSYTGSF